MKKRQIANQCLTTCQSTRSVDVSSGDDIRRLRSAVSFTCAAPRTRTRLGDRSFTVTGPAVLNSFPRVVDDYERFRRLLKKTFV